MGTHKRDYSLLGRDGQRAVDKGLATAEWYHTDVPRKAMKQLMKRSDWPALRDTGIWIGAMLVLAGIGAYLWPSLWCIPFFLAYGVLYGSGGDSRWHECMHGTPFKTYWMNRVVYQIGSFMMMRNPVTWRWQHARHHTDTLIVGRDKEITIMRPPRLLKLCLNIFGLLDVPSAMKTMVLNAVGILDAEEKTFVPAKEQHKVTTVARIWLLIYTATVAACFILGSILPLVLIGLPRIYGCWHHILTGLLQHGGLAENVTDHRLNCRTVYMNPISRFIYWNMNYHVEHHMFPMVPYHALPKLHALLKDDMPAPSPSMLHAYREMWPILKRQLRDEECFLKRELPLTAKPYKAELHDLVAGIQAASHATENKQATA